MKQQNLILALVMFGALFGLRCTGPVEESQRFGGERFEGDKLTIEKGGFCLTTNRTEDCNRTKEKVYWLHTAGGELKMESSDQEAVNLPQNWVSIKRTPAIEAGVYNLQRRGGKLLLETGKEKIEFSGKKGLFFYLDQQGQVSIMKSGNENVPLHRIVLKDKMLIEDQVLYGNKMLLATAPVFEKSQEKTVQVIVQGDIDSRIIPNDTGTEIILEDILRALNCCDVAKDLDCCEGGGGSGKAVAIAPDPKSRKASDIPQLEEMSKGFPVMAMSSTIITGSWKTILTVEAADACLYRSGPYLIIIDCLTGEVWCLDSDECIILLESNAEGEIAIMVKEECTAFDSITPCK